MCRERELIEGSEGGRYYGWMMVLRYWIGYVMNGGVGNWKGVGGGIEVYGL